MKKIILIVFLLSTKFTFGQIINGGFEAWDTVYTNAYSSDLSSLFGVPDPKGGTIHSWTCDYRYGMSRTTNSYSGNYSLILHNWYTYAYTKISYKDTISFRPQYLHGYFKYITGGINGLSHGTASVTLTRANGTSNDTIATGTFQFDSTVSFTPFQMTLNYISALTPDTIYISVLNGNTPCKTYGVCNLLYLDNIILDNSSWEVENINSTKDYVFVYPNPAAHTIAIELKNISVKNELKIYDNKGALVKQLFIRQQKTTVDLGDLPNGIYYFTLTNESDNRIWTQKLMVE